MTNYHAVHEGILIQSSANLLDPHPGWSFKFVKPASCFQQPSECAPPAPAPPGLSAEDGSVIGSAPPDGEALVQVSARTEMEAGVTQLDSVCVCPTRTN